MLRAFNAGRAGAFANSFARPSFHPYAFRIRGGGFSTRRQITAFVRARHGAGDGWTAVRLVPPQGPAGLPANAVYSLSVRVSQHGRPITTRGVKIIVECRSGRVGRWLGPGIGPADVRPQST